MEHILSIFLAFPQLAVCLYIMYFEYKRRSCSVYLWAMLLVIFCLTHFLSVINYSSSDRFPLWVYNAASIFVFFFNAIYLTTRNLSKRKKSDRIFFNYSVKTSYNDILSKSQERLLWWLFYIMCGSALIRIYHVVKYSGSLFATSWADMLHSGGGYFGVEQIFRLFFYCTASLIYPSLYYKKKKLAILSALIVLFVTVVTRNRADILPLLISVIAYTLSKIRQINLRLVLSLSLLGMLSVVVVYSILLFRLYGSIDNFIENADFFVLAEEVMQSIQNDDGDLSVKDAFYFFISNDNSFRDFNSMHTYIRMALFFLPTQWSLGLKPEDFAETMGEACSPGSVGFSMHPTLYGDCFANMYYFGVLLAVFWAFFVRLLDRLLWRQPPISRMCGTVIVGDAFIMLGRGSVYNSFVSIIYGLLVLYAINVVCKMVNARYGVHKQLM